MNPTDLTIAGFQKHISDRYEKVDRDEVVNGGAEGQGQRVECGDAQQPNRARVDQEHAEVNQKC